MRTVYKAMVNLNFGIECDTVEISGVEQELKKAFPNIRKDCDVNFSYIDKIEVYE